MADHPALKLFCGREVPVLGNVLVVHVRVRGNFGGPSDVNTQGHKDFGLLFLEDYYYDDVTGVLF